MKKEKCKAYRCEGYLSIINSLKCFIMYFKAKTFHSPLTSNSTPKCIPMYKNTRTFTASLS